MIEPDKTRQLEQITLYRYLTFDRFLETLDKGLFIPKASLFKDRWEGMVYRMHEFLRERNDARSASKSGEDVKVPTLDDFCIPDNHKSIREGMKEIYTSCWNGTNYECVAMWKLYGKGENAVILETSAKELTDAFVNFNESEKKGWFACLKKLKYILPGDGTFDKVFDGEEPLWDTGFIKLLVNPRFVWTYTGLQYKHISYDFENEYRLLAIHKNRGDRQDKGIVLPLRKSFIKRVILQPGSSDIFADVVQDCLKKYDFNDIPVEKSFLDELPPLVDKYSRSNRNS